MGAILIDAGTNKAMQGGRQFEVRSWAVFILLERTG